MGIVFCSIDITIQMITSQMHTADAMMNARGKSPSYENSSNEFQQRIPAKARNIKSHTQPATFQTGISCLGNDNAADFQDVNTTPRLIRFTRSSFLCSLLSAPPQAINDMATRTHESLFAIAFLPRRNHTINCQADVKAWTLNAQHRKQPIVTRHPEFRR